MKSRTVLLLVLASVYFLTAAFRINVAGIDVNIIDTDTQTQKLWRGCYGTVTVNPNNQFDSAVNVYWCKSVQNGGYFPPFNIDGFVPVEQVIAGTTKGDSYHHGQCFIIRSFTTSYPGDTYNRTLAEVIC